MIAAELAVHLGGDLGVDSVGDVWDEIERLAPAYPGITQEVLDSRAPPTASSPRCRPAPVASVADAGPVDPIALPGVESVERQGAPPAGRPGRVRRPPRVGAGRPSAARRGRRRPGGPAGPGDLDVPTWPAGRLLAAPGGRAALYDAGAAVGAGAGPGRPGGHGAAAGQPYDLDRLGVAPGGPGAGALGPRRAVLPAVADAALPRRWSPSTSTSRSAGAPVADLIDSRPGGRRAAGVAVTPCCAAPLLGRRRPALRATAWAGSVSLIVAHQGAGGLRRPAGGRSC